MAGKSEHTPEPAGLITLEQAGRLLDGITAERVRQLMKEGWIPKERPGRVLMVAAVQGYIRYLKDVAKRTTKTAAESRVRDARAEEIEMRVAERRRELIPIDDATLALDLLVGRVKEEMGGIAARVTRDIDLRRKIEAEVNGAQARIAEALGASAELARTGKDVSGAIADNDA